MTENEIREMYDRYANALNTRRLDALDDLIGEEVALNGRPAARATVVAAIRHNLDVVPDMHWELTDLLIDGDRLAVRAVNTGTPTQEWLGVPPSGGSFATAEMAIYRVRDGRFIEMSFVHDAADLKRQLHAA
ncbi:MAG TPA: ester cyclase [Pseudolysinimonas sp.]|nr:ester cyclase [Pseudolysinimonas sp.]